MSDKGLSFMDFLWLSGKIDTDTYFWIEFGLPLIALAIVGVSLLVIFGLSELRWRLRWRLGRRKNRRK